MTKIRYTNLDAFRGIAALLVLLFHTPFINGSKLSFFQNSDIFVDFFFILSGFVISHSYLKKVFSGYPFKSFLQNRFARIYPLHIAILFIWLLFLICKTLISHHLNIYGDSQFINNDAYAFFLQVILLNAHGFDDHLSWNAPAWSIGAEFYTYLVFFILVRIFGLAKISLIAVIVVVSAYLAIYSIKPVTLLRTFDLGFIRGVGGFFTGVIIYILSQKLIKIEGMNYLSMTIVEAFCLIAIYFSVTFLAEHKNGQLIIFFVFASSILLFSKTAGLISKQLNSYLFQQLGKLSYSFYLLHVLVITVIANLWEIVYPSSVIIVEKFNSKLYQTDFAALINIAIILATFLLATLTYKFIEHPYQMRLRTKYVTK